MKSIARKVVIYLAFLTLAVALFLFSFHKEIFQAIFVYQSPRPGIYDQPRVLKDIGLVKKQLFSNELKIGQLHDIAEVDFDNDGTQELIVAGSQGTVFLTPDAKTEEQVMFSLDSKDILHLKILKENGNHIKFFYHGIGSSESSSDHIGIFDRQSRIIWRYEFADSSAVAIVEDIDLDGKYECILSDILSLTLFRDGEKLWQKKVLPELIGLMDVNFDNKPDILYLKWTDKRDKNNYQIREIAALDYNGQDISVNQPKQADNQLIIGVTTYPGTHKRYYMRFSGSDSERFINLFDVNGSLFKKLYAPYSGKIYHPTNVYSLGGFLGENGEEYLALLFSSHKRYDRSMLYLYASSGELVYQELLEHQSNALYFLKPGGLLVGNNEKLWLYSIQE